MTRYHDYGEFRKVRGDDKQFWWESRTARGWEKGAKVPPGTLYRIDEAAVSDWICIVEGEKDVDNLWRIGIPATSSAHGAGSWTPAHSEQLRGRDLVVFNDNDEAGYKHAASVVECSRGRAKSIKRIDLKDVWAEIQLGEDVSDFLAKGGGDREWLSQLILNADVVYSNGFDPAPETGTPPPASPWIFTRASAWAGTEPTPQEWTVDPVIPARQVCLFTGHGAAGKSTVAAHLATAHVAGRFWLNYDAAKGPAMYIDAEDEPNVIHRRIRAAADLYELSLLDLDDLHVLSLVGQGAVMAVANKNGVIEGTPLFKWVREQVAAIKPKQIIIASSANVFAGNENDRSHVTQFIDMLNGLALTSGGSVILIAHPSKSGMATEANYSGSTAWYNTVRSQMVLKGLDEGESDMRLLEFKKSQYGPVAASVTLRWRNGLFLPDAGISDFERAANEAKAEEVFVSILRRWFRDSLTVSNKLTARNYAPTVFGRDPEAKLANLSKRDFEAAMARLIDKGRVRVEVVGPASKQSNELRVVT